MDDALLIGISTQSDVASEPDNVAKIHAEVSAQFANVGYGEFIDFLGSLRPIVLEAIPTQLRRQRFFDALIDRIPGGKSGMTGEKTVNVLSGIRKSRLFDGMCLQHGSPWTD